MSYFYEEETPEYEEGKSYTNSQLELMANELLREDARSEVCRDCGERGEDTGQIESISQEIEDGSGNVLIIDYHLYSCKNSHSWYEGEGKTRGIGGDNSILFEEHLQSRRRREIYTTVGTPDPSIVQGIYNRTHPEGRKVNSEEQRRKHGASFFRG